MSSPVAVIATITAAPQHREAVEAALRIAVPLVRKEAGCEQYTLHRDLAQPDNFVMVERWSDEAALTQHVQAPAFLALAKALEGRAALSVTKLEPLV
ncbi:MAG: antibiotic biosynthesis monooxygenase [Candidatus Dactylopiibacterium carminicum]|uniref:Antibiotic biosynthesis monooxygenase n=1 Tax=Candidatus Dactylopiibacterium carminicum TaxID=857335 RepID=A0A272EMT3_9RHOO|nr:putative quinol monooxygenase [Candidatus Dactylopiibacterium carminicum]KAF7597848.1 antibiotic biosynthesis monooxygenase [Candidatus Dactylopiibacterium carminicum]PAS91438.1 MAG: antibiotic biosynthesis monooxygenase [Candidatus Dactylopiibacterium carminicum]PAS92580.1 MAG: antibiotic biosynthesis monooxygenase [Candidatus Dactylopiibacterium carminicum]PAS95714.1 MAG: antibiotic biosynthesis monooxygenase [Candidatus Dactylopiibacterium carminicum]